MTYSRSSASMVMTVLYDTLIPPGVIFLLCGTSHTTIMRVRRALSEGESERYIVVNLKMREP